MLTVNPVRQTNGNLVEVTGGWGPRGQSSFLLYNVQTAQHGKELQLLDNLHLVECIFWKPCCAGRINLSKGSRCVCLWITHSLQEVFKKFLCTGKRLVCSHCWGRPVTSQNHPACLEWWCEQTQAQSRTLTKAGVKTSFLLIKGNESFFVSPQEADIYPGAISLRHNHNLLKKWQH